MRWGITAIAALAMMSAARAAEPAGAGDIERYAGWYVAGPGLVVHIEAKDGHLLAHNVDQTETAYAPEGDGKFFASASDTHVVFQTSPDGQVMGALVSQGSQPPVPARRFTKTFADRLAMIAAGEAHGAAPGAEEVLRRFIGEIQRGQPDYSRMSPQLANAVRQTLDNARTTVLLPLGDLKTVTYQSTLPDGRDLFTTQFDKGALEWRIGVGDNGRVEVLQFGPLQGPIAARAPGFAGVDAAFAAEQAAHPVGGMTVGVVDHGKLVWTRSYGLADMASKTPADRATVYRIGSITKQFTGLLLLKLAAEGKVKLDDPASKYLPELGSVRNIGAAAPSITLLSLATHRAGLSREPDDMATLSGPIDRWEVSTRQALAHTSFAFKANDQGVYSNIGYAALGLALENATHVPYTELVEREILKPLGMASTSFRPDAAMKARLARGYSAQGGAPSSAQADSELVKGRGYKIPNGGLFTTVDDLARFMAFEMGEGPAGVLPPDTLTANFARSFPMQGGGRYGVGYMTERIGTLELVGHGGAVAGFTSSAFFDPRTKIGIVCLRSSEFGCEGRFLAEAFAALSTPPPPRPPA
jgi:CubicO group peptidase (beta-lactamase class C family)